jgi:hypothetical protein
MATTEAPDERTQRLFLTRGVVAIAWAAVFAAADSLTVGVGVLLVAYPLIDLVASLIDARSQRGSARQLLLVNAAVSALAAVALGVAATGTVSNVFGVFGVSVIGGVAFVLAAVVADDPDLSMLAIYAATGGTEFVIQAWLLARRRRRLAEPAGLSLSTT